MLNPPSIPCRRTYRWTLALGLSSALATAACRVGGDLDNGSCDMDTGLSPLVGSLTVQYFASATGDAAMSSLTYATQLGSRTIDNPKLPYSTTVQLTTERARMRAKGTSGSGSLAIGYAVSDIIGLLDRQQATCP